VADVGDAASGRVDEEVFCEGFGYATGRWEDVSIFLMAW
jgi:hypothetical protein